MLYCQLLQVSIITSPSEVRLHECNAPDTRSPRSQTLASWSAASLGGGIRVVDLTVPLEPATPTIQLPPQFAPSKPFSLEEISRYDERGPAWYWNNIACGEHTGTHFDAPIHWVTGKDYPNNATHNIPVDRFIGPACVIDVAAQAEAESGLPADPRGRRGVGEQARPHSGACLGADPHRLVAAQGRARTSSTPGRTARTRPGFHPQCVPFLAKERDILGVGVETVGTDAGQAHTFDPMFPCHTIMHGSNRFGLASLTNLDQLPPTGAVVIAPPLKIVNGSGSPLRVLALVPA